MPPDTLTTTMHHYPVPPPTAQAEETTDLYGRRILAYALHYGITALDSDQRRLCDAAAQATVCSLPRVLEPHQAKLIQVINILRHQLAQADAQRRAQLAQLQKMADALDPSDDPEELAQPSPDAPQMSDAERLQRLLAAVIKLATQPPDQNGGGRPARLQPPRPTLPSGGQALPQPTTTRRPGHAIDF